MYQYKKLINYLDKSICMGALSSGSTSVPKVLYRTYESWAGFFPIQNGIFNISGNQSCLLMEHLVLQESKFYNVSII